MSNDLVVERDKLESILPLLGATINEDGYIVDSESGEVIPTREGEEITIDEIGYLGHGSIEPVKDDLPSIVSYLSDEKTRDD